MGKKNWREVVPQKFYKGDRHPRARTVGQLIGILQELPASLRVEATFGEAPEVVVYNIGDGSRHVRIQEPPAE